MVDSNLNKENILPSEKPLLISRYLSSTLLREGTWNAHLYEIDQTTKQQIAD